MGFVISCSYADNAINGDRVNATMYYVLSQSPTPLHSGQTSEGKRSELQGFLSYTEGCYSGIRTLQATNLWTPLTSLTRVDTVVSYWLLNLEKNGCHNLLRAGADGVMQVGVGHTEGPGAWLPGGITTGIVMYGYTEAGIALLCGS